MMDIAAVARKRHSCKGFDPERKVPAGIIAQLRTVLRYSPSSVNGQPWHFFVAESEAARARIARAMPGNFAYNATKVANASHVVVLCALTEFDDSRLAALLAQEDGDGRFADAATRERQSGARGGYVRLHRETLADLRHWMEKQVYIALGFLLLAAGTLGIDACPIEGFDKTLLDEELGLAGQGLASLVVVTLGYRGADDFNAALPKSRLPENAVFTDL